MRRALVLTAAVALAAVALLASPAAAKGFSSVKFTGPGLPPGGIKVHPGNEGGRTMQVLWSTGVFQTLNGPTPWARGVARSDLGPRYRMTVTPDWDRRTHVYAFVYPYAKGGPWSYFPSGQTVDRYGNKLDSGWWKVGHRAIGSDSAIMIHQFRAFLIRHGFPATAPQTEAVAKPAPAAHPVPAPTTDGWPVWIWGVLAIGLAGSLVLVATRQRRRVAA